MGKANEFYDGLGDVELREFYNAWRDGEMSKFDIEHELGDHWSRGQGITRAWRARLDLETAGVDWRDLKIAELEARIEELEIELEGERG